jgi:uncharacterized protein YidB (DUF937 family)
MQQLKNLFGGGTKTGESDLAGSIFSLVGSMGGLQALLGKFQAAGMGDKVDSWLSPHEHNLPLSAHEVRQALGNDEVDTIARKAGMPSDKAADGLARLIPDTVNKLTPDGQVPDATTLQKKLGSMGIRVSGM